MTHLTPVDSTTLDPALAERKAVSIEAQQLLRELEASIDNTLHLNGRLAAFLPQARMRARMSGVVGQSIFEQVAEMQSHLTRGRKSCVEVHNSLEATRRLFGIPLLSAPDMKPPASARRAEAESARASQTA